MHAKRPGSLYEIAEIRTIQSEQARARAGEAAGEARCIREQRAAMSAEMAERNRHWAASMSKASFDPSLLAAWLHKFTTLEARANELGRRERRAIECQQVAARSWYEAEMRADHATARARDAHRRALRQRDEAQLVEAEDSVARRWRSS